MYTRFVSPDFFERMIERLLERALEKIGFVLIDLLAPHAIDLATNLFLNLHEGLEKLADYLHDKFYGDNEFFIEYPSLTKFTLSNSYDAPNYEPNQLMGFLYSAEKTNMNQLSIE